MALPAAIESVAFVVGRSLRCFCARHGFVPRGHLSSPKLDQLGSGRFCFLHAARAWAILSDEIVDGARRDHRGFRSQDRQSIH